MSFILRGMIDLDKVLEQKKSRLELLKWWIAKRDFIWGMISVNVLRRVETYGHT